MAPKKRLTEKLLEKSNAMPARGRSNRNIAQFIANKEEIREALGNGWSMKAIWDALHQDGLFLGEYCSFTLYVKKFIRAENSIRPVESVTPPSTPETASEVAPSQGVKIASSSLPQGFQHDPVPPKPEQLF